MINAVRFLKKVLVLIKFARNLLEKHQPRVVKKVREILDHHEIAAFMCLLALRSINDELSKKLSIAQAKG